MKMDDRNNKIREAAKASARRRIQEDAVKTGGTNDAEYEMSNSLKKKRDAVRAIVERVALIYGPRYTPEGEKVDDMNAFVNALPWQSKRNYADPISWHESRNFPSLEPASDPRALKELSALSASKVRLFCETCDTASTRSTRTLFCSRFAAKI